MKKLVLSLAVLFSVAMVSCGGAKSENADSAAVDSANMEETVVVASDSDSNGGAEVVAVEVNESAATAE